MIYFSFVDWYASETILRNLDIEPRKVYSGKLERLWELINKIIHQHFCVAVFIRDGIYVCEVTPRKESS